MEDTAVADRNTVDVIPALGDEGVGAADRGGINGTRGLEIEAAVRCRGPVELSDQSVAGGYDGDAEGLDAKSREIRAGPRSVMLPRPSRPMEWLPIAG